MQNHSAPARNGPTARGWARQRGADVVVRPRVRRRVLERPHVRRVGGDRAARHLQRLLDLALRAECLASEHEHVGRDAARLAAGRRAASDAAWDTLYGEPRIK